MSRKRHRKRKGTEPNPHRRAGHFHPREGRGGVSGGRRRGRKNGTPHGRRGGPQPGRPTFDSPKGKALFREITGMVQGSDRGFGFFIPEDQSPDAFLPPREMRHIMHGDVIRARVSRDPRKEGKYIAEFVAVVKRSSHHLVGTIRRKDGKDWLEPQEARIAHWVDLRPGRLRGNPGDKAVAKILRWPSPGREVLEGELVEVLGPPDAPGVDIEVIIRKVDWPREHGSEARRQAECLPENPGEADFRGRRDLRDRPALTIDGADAKDFDDAVSLESLPGGGNRLWVHIADVSHYVPEGSALDREARQRSTSVYLADRVLPMLPEALSNGLCSLQEGVPRLTLTAVLDYDARGELTGADFQETVIQSRVRGIYEEVQRVLDKEEDARLRARYAPVRDMLFEMRELARKLQRRREARGALDFDFPEVRAVLDDRGNTVDIRRRDRLEAHRLIENFMIAANEAVATYLWKHRHPAVYRIHEAPNAKDLEELKAFLKAYGIPFRHRDLTSPLGLRDLLSGLKDDPLAPTLSALVLRSLKLAVYATRNAGHFGLALSSYCHFTSPIRRYPDLVVHRALRNVLRGTKPRAGLSFLDTVATHASAQERLAEKAERESQRVKQLRFMEDKIGRVFEGRITHLLARGAFVELDPYGLEGFIALDRIPGGPFEFEEASLSLKGPGGRRLLLGERVRVVVEAVDALGAQRLELRMEP